MGDLGENHLMECQGKKTNESWLRRVGDKEVDTVSVNNLVKKFFGWLRRRGEVGSRIAGGELRVFFKSPFI